MGEVIPSWNGDGEEVQEERPPQHFKPMTNNTNTNVAKSSFVKQAATGVAFALAPFAIALSFAGVAALDTPSSEARSCVTWPSGYKACM